MPNIGVLSHKGGVSKTTLAVHLAYWLHEQGESVTLIDGDPKRWALKWGRNGPGFPFPAVSVEDKFEPTHWHVVDSRGHPSDADVAAIARRSSVLVLPVADQESLASAIEIHRAYPDKKLMAVITRAPRKPSTIGHQLRIAVAKRGIPVTGTILYELAAWVTAKHEGTSVLHCSQRGSTTQWLEFDAVAREIAAHATG